MDSELDGRVVVVTGGSRGLGREVVLACADRGAKVVIASRKLEACEQVAAEVRDRGGEALPVAVNVSDWAQCDHLADTVRDHWGRVDVLVNNAGLSPHYPSLPEVSEALFDKVVAVNLRGPFRLTALIGSRMAADGGGGSIINIGSIEAIRPSPQALPYAAAKAGLHVLTEGFAQAFGPTVRINTVQAGPFLTDISEHWADGMREEVEAQVALERCGEPHEIVGAVLFFATSASSYASGSVLRLDGGWR
ncbi:SDR family NAD(P)-dependent oxidoreductase [Actinomycetospora sp. CA-084318]|uniref:SDR family NAD(P)-dependent oxidoreductase n=1 Tax=Actinomycetospora sp. CA-084318 TaxID=3239892 RepID=UPI003D96F000